MNTVAFNARRIVLYTELVGIQQIGPGSYGRSYITRNSFRKNIIYVQTERKICGIGENSVDCPTVVQPCKHATLVNTS